MGPDRRTDDALAVLAWLRRYASEKGVEGEALTVTRRDVYLQYKGGRFKKVTDVYPVLELLTQHGWLRATGEGKIGRGRSHPSPSYWLHQELADGE